MNIVRKIILRKKNREIKYVRPNLFGAFKTEVV